MKNSLIIILSFLFFQSGVTQNIPHANYGAPWGVQVNTYNGNLFLKRTDLVIPNQGLSIDFSFAYNSFRDTIDLGFGKGWTSNYSFRYESINADTMIVDHPDGRVDVFAKSGTDYLSPAGIFDQWEEYESGKFSLTTKHGMTYFFDNASNQRLTRITDANGNQLILTYNGDELMSVQDNSGRIVTLSWSSGHLTTITDPNFSGQRTIGFAYSGDLLTQVTDPEGGTFVYDYDQEERINHLINEKDDEMRILYNERGEVALIATCITQIKFTYNKEQNTTYATEKNEGGDRITTYNYDDEGKLTQKTGSCCGFNTRYEYDIDNNINSVTDANSNSFTASHDAFGNALQSTDADGANQSYTFENNFNQLASLTDKKGNTTFFTYDGNGNLIQINQPESVTIELEYDGFGNVTALKDGNSNSTSYAYNPNNDVIGIQYPIGNETYGYDGIGNLTVSTDGNGNKTNFAYDGLNRLTSFEDDLGNKVQYEYDNTSNQSKETDANNNEKSYEYDAHHRLSSVTTEAGTTNYQYDASDNITGILDDKQQLTRFTYNEQNLLSSRRDPLNNTTAFTYDGNGNTLSRTDANGMVTNYSYDNLNRLLSKSYDGNTDNYSYDANGNVIQSSNNEISMSFTYDELNRMTAQSIDNWALTISYEYDFANNRTKMIDPSGTTNYEYDANNRMVKMTNPSGEETKFIYDNGSRLIRKEFHNGTITEYNYNVANQLTSLVNQSSTGTVLSSYTYTYDGNGNRLSRTTLDGTANYTYDGDNRLKTVNYTGISATDENYEFDGVGNRTSKNGMPYSYDAANRLQSAENRSYQFDGNGNLIEKQESGQTTSYIYDGENRLTQMQLPDGSVVAFQYDPFGNRISQTNQNGTTRYLLDGDNVLMELDGDGNTLARYTSGLTLDSWVSMERSGQSYFYHTDGLGSVTTLTNHSETVEVEYQYDAFGNILSQTGNVTNPYTYTGREFDEATGLYYLRTRFYDAAVGRFITKDGFSEIQEFPQSLNRYTYVFQNPMTYTDPTGELFFAVLLIPVAKVAITSFLGAVAIGTVSNVVGQAVELESLDGEIDCGKAIVNGIDEGIKEFWDPSKKIKRGLKQGQRAFRLFWKKKKRKTGLRLLGRGAKNYVKGSVQGGVYDYLKEGLEEKLSFNCNPFSPGSQEEEMQGPIPAPPTLPDDKMICIPIVRSVDPNEIIAPEGCGTEKWVAQSATLPYTILYENDPDFATAPAQTVVIEHYFDEQINPFAFRLGDFGFGNYYFEVPEDVSYYNTQIDLSDSLGVILAVTAGVDINDNRAFWIFESRDPATGFSSTLPADVGYLPVNDSITHAGEGFVNFTVKPSTNSVTGDTIHAEANIIFDDNPPIETNLAFNLIDADDPVSQISAIDTLGNTFVLHWSGTDEGVGLTSYALYMSTNDGPFLLIAGDLTATTYTFVGEANQSYAFFTIATDCVGNIEPLKTDGENGCALLATSTLVHPTGTNADGSILISVSGANGTLTYEWSPDVGTDSLANNLISDTYFVTVTDALGCSTTLEAVLDSSLVSTHVPIVETQLFIHRLFPVPAKSVVNIEFSAPTNVAWLEVFDALGKRVLSRTVSTVSTAVNRESIEVSDWAAGSYLVRIRTRERTVSGLFLKQ